MEEDPKDLIAEGDAAYKPFQPFSEWADLIVDKETWDTQRQAIESAAGSDPEILRRASDAAKTAAAIDTGRLEDLYQVDRGKTISAAVEAGYFQEAFASEPARTRQLIESQLAVYDDVLDFATDKLDLLAAWVRALHAKLCEAQETYEAVTPSGSKENRPLPRGEYKTTANHVIQPDGTIFAYAPVLETDVEMERYLAEIRGAAFRNAHPILQAAFAHYAFVRIHPFTDGNGRMARALASIFTYRGGSIPLMILFDQRDAYLHSLREADRGRIQGFVNFIQQCCFNTFVLVRESLQTAEVPRAADVSEAIARLFVTKGGYSHAQVDQCAVGLLALVDQHVQEMAKGLVGEHLKVSSVQTSITYGLTLPPGYRTLVSPKQHCVRVVASSPPPGEASTQMVFWVAVPADAAASDPILLVNNINGRRLLIEVSDLVPNPNIKAELATRLYLQHSLSMLFKSVLDNAKGSLRSVGYSS